MIAKSHDVGEKVNAAVVRTTIMRLFGEACLVVGGGLFLRETGRRVHDERSGVSSGA
jgi:hypothetical protein